MNKFSLEELEEYKEFLTHSIVGLEDDGPIYDATGDTIELTEVYDVDNMTEQEMLNECKRLGLITEEDYEEDY